MTLTCLPAPPRRATRLRVVSGFLLILAATARPAGGQAAPSSGANELSLHAEPLAAGGRYSRALGTRWRIGPSLTIGPFEGVTLRRGQSGRLKEWATTYATVSFSPAAMIDLVASPIGAALALGDDFSSVYPSAQFGVQVGERWVFGTDLRVIRIAGPAGSGLYWVQWIPARVGVRWRW
jgi:hypothetical protein